jgi:hypothetical protein
MLSDPPRTASSAALVESGFLLDFTFGSSSKAPSSGGFTDSGARMGDCSSAVLVFFDLEPRSTLFREGDSGRDWLGWVWRAGVSLADSVIRIGGSKFELSKLLAAVGVFGGRYDGAGVDTPLQRPCGTCPDGILQTRGDIRRREWVPFVKQKKIVCVVSELPGRGCDSEKAL